MKGSKFVPHVLKEISSSVKPKTSFGISLDNDVSKSSCRLGEENNNTVIKKLCYLCMPFVEKVSA